MTFEDISPPTTGPVTVSVAKTFIRVDHDVEDMLISDLIATATQHIETRIGGSLITRPQRCVRPISLHKSLYLNRCPLVSVERIHIGSDLDPTTYLVETRSHPASISLVSGRNWADQFPDEGLVEIDFTAGYGTVPEDVPVSLRQAVLLFVAHLYENRNAPTPPIPMMVEALLSPYQGVRL